jgi:hypothetical protein
LNTDLYPPASREDRFEERLLTAILDDFDQLTSPAARPHWAGRPRTARRRAAAALIAAAAAGIAAASIAAAGAARPGEHPGHATGTAAGSARALPSPKLQTAAYVVDHMKSALNANTAVVDIIDHAPDSQTGQPVIDEIWSSSLSDTYRIVDRTPAGAPTTGYLVTVTPHRTTSIVVDYGKRTWSKTTYSFGSASDGRRPGPQPATPLQLAAQLRAEVKAGQATLVGWATVDGQRAIHLTERLANGQVNLWVNPGTYLPVRVIGTAPGMSQTSDQAIRDDYRWLPATPANLRLLTPAGAIPAGFTRTGPWASRTGAASAWPWACSSSCGGPGPAS